MKKNLLLFGLFLSVQSLFAQDAAMMISPNPVIELDVEADDFEGIGHANAFNLTDDTLSVRWTRKVIMMTEEWQSAICDKNQCFFPSVSSQPFLFLPGESARLDVHVYPNDFEGEALIEVKLVNVNDTTQYTTGVYYFNMSPSSTVDAKLQAAKVYPNPTSGAFTLSGVEDVARIDVFDMAGRVMRQFQYRTGDTYDIADLPKGNYMLRLLSNDGQRVAGKLLAKE